MARENEKAPNERVRMNQWNDKRDERGRDRELGRGGRTIDKMGKGVKKHTRDLFVHSMMTGLVACLGWKLALLVSLISS